MTKGIKHWNFYFFRASYGWSQVYSGRGYLQGLGFDIAYKALTVGKFKVITDIVVETGLI